MTDDSDEPRRFNLRQRRALFFAAGGECEECGKELEPGWHADHIDPWSRGGETDVINGQALCPDCNWLKGNNRMLVFDDLRPWQKAFSLAYIAYHAPNFLLVCLPGGGKTIASLWVAKEWLNNAGMRPRLIIHVSPLKQLKSQFKRSAKKDFGLEFQASEFDGKIKPGMHGLCFTYSGMAAASESIRILCGKYEVMVIFDEPHHMSEDATSPASWGKQAIHAFENASRRLFMTGTPWRQDMEGMPFISGIYPNHGKRLEDGTYRSDYEFNWPYALQEKPRPIRILSFRYFDDVVQYEDSETQEICSIDSREFRNAPIDSLNQREKDKQDRWLNGAIRGSAMVPEMIAEAHAKLMEVRAHKPDAGGIIVCEGQIEASKIATRVKKVTGVTPHLIVSDDEISSQTVEDFNRDKGVWIVSVRKVSEGIDIPRLIVGVYLTNYRTELYFRQFVGRVVRNENTKFDSEAYVFIPKHWQLMEYARKIEEVQAIALSKGAGGGGGGGPGTRTTYIDDDGAKLAGVLLPNSKIDSSDVSSIDQLMARYRHLGMTETLAAQLVRDGSSDVQSVNPATTAPEEASDLPLEDQMEAYRKAIWKKVQRLAFIRGARDDDSLFKKVSEEANTRVGIKSVYRANLDQLKAMSSYLDQKIAVES